jgi:hypothetical protein
MITVQEEKMRDGFIKYHLKNAPFGCVIHRISDVDKMFHDHPFSFHSIILHGSYEEEVLHYPRSNYYRTGIVSHSKGDSFYIRANHVHRIIGLPEGEVWSLILPEEKVQESGFYQITDEGILYRQWNEPEFKLIKKCLRK